jgi:hypothetical protein
LALNGSGAKTVCSPKGFYRKLKVCKIRVYAKNTYFYKKTNTLAFEHIYTSFLNEKMYQNGSNILIWLELMAPKVAPYTPD